MNKSSYKHIPHREKPPHLVAKRNERERRRVQQVNSAFSVLRKTVPVENRNKRLSKVKTLQRAIEYIESLTDLLSSLGAQMPTNGSSSSCNSISNVHNDELAISSDASPQSQSPFMLIGDADSSISPVGSPTVITTTSNETYLDSEQMYQLPYSESSGSVNNNDNNSSSKNSLNQGNIFHSSPLNHHHHHHQHSHHQSPPTHHLHHQQLHHQMKQETSLEEGNRFDCITTIGTNGGSSQNNQQFHMSSFHQLNHSFSFALTTSDINSNMNNNCITSHNEIVSSGHNNTSSSNPSSDPNANSRSNDFTSLYSLQLQ